MDSKLIRKISACGLGVTTSLMCPASSCKAQDVDSSSGASINVDKNDVSSKNRTVATVLGFLAPVIGNWYEGKIGAGFGLMALGTLGVMTLSTFGLPATAAGILTSVAINGYNGLKCALGAAKDGDGKLIKNW